MFILLLWKLNFSFYEFLVSLELLSAKVIILTFMNSKLNKISTVPPAAYLHSLGSNFSWINNRSYRVKGDSKWIIPRSPSIFPKSAVVNVIFHQKAIALLREAIVQKYYNFVNNFKKQYPTALTMASFSYTLIITSLVSL